MPGRAEIARPDSADKKRFASLAERVAEAELENDASLNDAFTEALRSRFPGQSERWYAVEATSYILAVQRVGKTTASKASDFIRQKPEDLREVSEEALRIMEEGRDRHPVA